MSFALRMYYAMTFVTDKSVANSGGEISSTGNMSNKRHTNI